MRTNADMNLSQYDLNGLFTLGRYKHRVSYWGLPFPLLPHM